MEDEKTKVLEHAKAIGMAVVRSAIHAATLSGKEGAAETAQLVGPDMVEIMLGEALKVYDYDLTKPVEVAGLELFELAAKIGIDQALEDGGFDLF